MGAWLGPRWTEAVGLRICDLDMLRREVTFGRLVVNQTGSTTFTERGSKTDDWRTLPAPTLVIDVLAEHITRYVANPAVARLPVHDAGRHASAEVQLLPGAA
jgi:hypothetical protein